MTSRSIHPLRVRLYGGRNTHAAHDLNSGGHLTACDYTLNEGAANHWMPATATVTCRSCARAIATEGVAR